MSKNAAASPPPKQPAHPFKHLIGRRRWCKITFGVSFGMTFSVPHFPAGGIAGATEAFILYPAEFVKTQLQLQSNVAAKQKFSGPWDCLRTTIRERGVSGLYRGMNVLVTGTFVKAAIRFYSFNSFKNALADGDGKLSPLRTMLAGMGAGMTEAVFAVTPMETIKTKLIHDRNSANPQYRGMIHGTAKIWRQSGLRGMYQGLLPTMLRQGANSAIRFTVFQNAQGFWKEWIGKGSDAKVTATMSFLSGAFAGTWATVLTMPIDVVKTRMQGMDVARYRNSAHCLATVFREEGLRALWKGTTPRLSRVMFSSGIVFAVQDWIMRNVFA